MTSQRAVDPGYSSKYGGGNTHSRPSHSAKHFQGTQTKNVYTRADRRRRSTQAADDDWQGGELPRVNLLAESQPIVTNAAQNTPSLFPLVQGIFPLLYLAKPCSSGRRGNILFPPSRPATAIPPPAPAAAEAAAYPFSRVQHRTPDTPPMPRTLTGQQPHQISPLRSPAHRPSKFRKNHYPSKITDSEAPLQEPSSKGDHPSTYPSPPNPSCSISSHQDV